MPLSRKKMTFKGSQDHDLVGIVDFLSARPHGFVILAHCFTCTKDLAAESRIAKVLVVAGWAVLRFDFAGLGESKGDFFETNFISNVNDLMAAAAYLKKEHELPSIMIGHSLGGTATLAAAQLSGVKAVVTIGSPFSPLHVMKQFKDKVDEIREQGQAQVNLAGRLFVFKKQFLEDLERQNVAEQIKQLKKSLLVFHSPQDATVSIDECR